MIMVMRGDDDDDDGGGDGDDDDDEDDADDGDDGDGDDDGDDDDGGGDEADDDEADDDADDHDDDDYDIWWRRWPLAAVASSPTHLGGERVPYAVEPGAGRPGGVRDDPPERDDPSVPRPHRRDPLVTLVASLLEKHRFAVVVRFPVRSQVHQEGVLVLSR